jgi:hypothetical protein
VNALTTTTTTTGRRTRTSLCISFGLFLLLCSSLAVATTRRLSSSTFRICTFRISWLLLPLPLPLLNLLLYRLMLCRRSVLLAGHVCVCGPSDFGGPWQWPCLDNDSAEELQQPLLNGFEVDD